jgi:hypothetical protein
MIRPRVTQGEARPPHAGRVRPAAAVGSLVFGVLGVGAVLVFPTVALILGMLALALGAYGRRSFPWYESAAAVGLLLGTIAVVGVLLIIVFLSS